MLGRNTLEHQEATCSHFLFSRTGIDGEFTTQDHLFKGIVKSNVLSSVAVFIKRLMHDVLLFKKTPRSVVSAL